MLCNISQNAMRQGGYPGQVPPPGGGTRVGQQKEYSLHGGRYASCVHAGGLSCFILFLLLPKISRLVWWFTGVYLMIILCISYEKFQVFVRRCKKRLILTAEVIRCCCVVLRCFTIRTVSTGSDVRLICHSIPGSYWTRITRGMPGIIERSVVPNSAS